MTNTEPLTTDPEIIGDLLTELDGMARQWHTYPDRNPGNYDDQFSRDSGFVSALQLCARQLQDVLRRQRSYAAATAGEEWDFAKAAMGTGTDA